ncbi:putative mitochondrial protein [Andalucia godoyi]|uniref:Putative mitochondrial protein n=1 Tax=Andalucia godoyi TaxID=505711 RepID=A0A8K0AHV0_ANDGO|nr:putative mitochondrial protein [Andalucia godoyi]|eukprot:ANDGO_04668.mRNA.1 putative mitochondrial protein
MDRAVKTALRNTTDPVALRVPVQSARHVLTVRVEMEVASVPIHHTLRIPGVQTARLPGTGQTALLHVLPVLSNLHVILEAMVQDGASARTARRLPQPPVRIAVQAPTPMRQLCINALLARLDKKPLCRSRIPAFCAKLGSTETPQAVRLAQSAR